MPDTLSSYPGTLSLGSKGDDVKKIQTALKIEADGVFGSQTEQAVKDFQQKNNLRVDGIVGAATWDKLIPPRQIATVTGNTASNTLGISPIINIPQLNGFTGITPINTVPRVGMTSSVDTLKNSIKAKFEKKVDDLFSKVINTGLDITKYLLPDEEIVKNFLTESIPSFSAEDLNIMVYGTSVNPNLDIAGNFTNIKSQLENAIKNTQQQIRNAATTTIANVQQQAQNAQAQIGAAITNTTQDLQSIGSVEARNFLQPGQVDISQLFNVPTSKYVYAIQETDTEYVVNVKYRRFDQGVIEVGTKKYPKDYKIIVEGQVLSGKENLEKVLQDEAEKKGFFGYLKDETKVAVKAQQEEIRRRAEAIGNAVETRFDKLKNFSNYSPYPIKKDSAIWKKVDSEKKLIKIMVHKFMEHQKDVFNAMITSISQTSSAIPAIGIIISTPPFNLPAAISLGTLVLSAINELVSKIPPILDYLEHLKRLSMFVSKRAYQELVRILNPVVELLIRLMDPLAILKKFIAKLLEAIKKLFSSQSCNKQKKRIKRDIRRKKRDISKEKDEEEKADMKEELKDLEDRLADVEKKCSGNKAPIEQDIQDLNQVLQDANTLSEEMLGAVEEIFVYDVTLPDGAQIIGITQEELDSLRTKYNVIVG